MKLKKLFVASLLIAPFMCSFSAFAQFSGGDGSQNNPYQIANEDDLITLSKTVSGIKVSQEFTFEGKYFKQIADITLRKGILQPIGMMRRDGDSVIKKPFKGVYDGGNHMISNLYMGDYGSDDVITYTSEGIGLFGLISGNTAAVKNLFIVSGKVAGYWSVGGIAGKITDGAVIEHCGTGTNFQVLASLGYSGGIVGIATNASHIKQCVNFADVFCNSNNSFNAGGIVGDVEDSYISGCANYGDIFAPRFAGGIVGYMPLEIPGFKRKYYPVKSSYNAGVITTSIDGAGGIIGAWGYQSQSDDKKVAVMNSYDYGRVYSFGTMGPIIAVNLPSPQESTNTYFDVNRFFNNADQTPFIHGEGKTHEEMYSEEILNKLNEGTEIKFVQDTSIMNQKYPVLKWLFDLKVNHSSVYAELTKAYPESIYTQTYTNGYLFEPNRDGFFYFINKDKAELHRLLKAYGVKRGAAAFGIQKAEKGNKIQDLICICSLFQPPLTNDFLWDNSGNNIPTTDRWVITPEFPVTKSAHIFYWTAASEDSNFKEKYSVYVGGENDITAEAYSGKTPAFSTEAEDGLKKGVEIVKDDKGNDVKRTYFILNDRHIDLSKYIGKTVRIAFHDNTHDKFSLWLGNMRNPDNPSAVAIVSKDKISDIRVLPQHLLRVETSSASRIYIYSLDGKLMMSGENQLEYQALKSEVVLVKIVSGGKYTTEKVCL